MFGKLVTAFLFIVLHLWTVKAETGSSDGVLEFFSCNFQTDYCRWRNDSKADFYWIRNKGRTPSDETGPQWDHTTQDADQGYYLYIETSLPRQNGDRARIISPTLNNQGKYCLKLWHNMHGHDVRDLNIYAREVDSRKKALISHLSGAWSTEGTLQLRSYGGNSAWWNEHEVEISTVVPIQIIVEGVRGGNYRGDIAIDDITLENGACGIRTPDCDFENNTCGWTQMSSDEFNWLPNKGETHTRYTGPPVDHTLGTANGRYLYIESSWPRNEGDRARLLSPPISCIQNAQPVFRFWYHMKGSTIGPLRVYVVANETQSLGQPIWHFTGEQGNDWREAEISLPWDRIRDWDKFHIVIEGERKEFRGDTAIDDLSLIGCTSLAPSSSFQTTTESILATTTQTLTTDQQQINSTYLPDELLCTFEAQQFCLWKHDLSGDFQWVLNQGPTTSSKTGPLFDHTTRNGWYAYMESSSPRENGDRALIRSPTISSDSHICFTFSYHMYGDTMGKLDILTAEVGTQSFVNKWTVSGQQSVNETDWKTASVDITESFNYDIIIQGIRGDNLYSDIALDDIIVTSTPCPTQLPPSTKTTDSSITDTTPDQEQFIHYSTINCDFDQFDFCNWQQRGDDNFNFSVSGSTPSLETGPANDHTGGGQFAYIEASNPQKEGYKAAIESPVFNSTNPLCFTFWYQMHGSQIGNFSVYQITYQQLSNGTTVEAKRKTLWNVEGDMGPTWDQLQLNLQGIDVKSIVIEATVGPGWRGDIAIDDIVLENGECAIFNCTFQTGTCGWAQETENNDFDWMRNQDDTPTENTGPQTDHTYKNDQGYYLFIETSSPRVPGDKARLSSPIVTGTTNPSKCLQFWYHSYGRDVGVLNVYKKNVNDTSSYKRSPLWFQSEDEGDQWLHAQINIEDNFPYKIIFEGVRGPSYQGDIAIDDVTISDGRCLTCCRNDVFRCGNNFCVPSSKRCDGVDDCGDMSDESFCGACGSSFFSPITSSNYGTVLDDVSIASPTITSHTIRNANSRGIFIEVDQLSLIRHRGLKRRPIDSSNVGANDDEEIDLEQVASYQAPEIIKLRRKRSLNFSSVAESISSIYHENETSTTFATETVTQKLNYSIINLVSTIQQLIQTSKPTTATPETSSSKGKEEKETGKGKQNKTNLKTGRNKTPYKLVNRGAERINPRQWFILRHSLRRDKGKEREEEEEREEEQEEEEEEQEEEREKPVRKVKRFAQLRIVGGNVAAPHSWPWHGAYYIVDSYTDSHYLCGATLIAPYWAVTAAHCPQLGDIHTVVFGDHDLYVDEGTEREMKVDAIYVNRQYRFPDNLGGDIALIKLKYPVPTSHAIQPACLPPDNEDAFTRGYVCAITGWGRARVDEAGLERVLRQGEVPIITQQACNSTYSGSIQDVMFCAGGTGANTCRGDSGGPLICKRNDTSYLIGITSWGDERCLPNVPGVYTRIKSFLQWMLRIQRQVDTCS